MSAPTPLGRMLNRRHAILALSACALMAVTLFAVPSPSSPPGTLFAAPASAASNLSLCGKGDPFCLGSAAFKGGVVSSADAKISPAAVVGKIIQMLLGLIGVVFFGLMFWGGFRWMTARGNQENAESAKQTLENGTIGFLVVLIAYALTTFIVTNLFNSSTTSTPVATPTEITCFSTSECPSGQTCDFSSAEPGNPGVCR